MEDRNGLSALEAEKEGRSLGLSFLSCIFSVLPCVFVSPPPMGHNPAPGQVNRLVTASEFGVQERYQERERKDMRHSKKLGRVWLRAPSVW